MQIEDVSVLFSLIMELIWPVIAGTSSMVAAICYGWLLENRMSNNRGKGDGDGGNVVVPVMNFKRSRMWKQRQAAWLFHHVGLDATSVLFADEVLLHYKLPFLKYCFLPAYLMLW